MPNNQPKQPHDVLKLFRVILSEAATMFNKPQNAITSLEFRIAGDGRLGLGSMVRCGGYIALRDFVTKKSKAPINFISLKGKK